MERIFGATGYIDKILFFCLTVTRLIILKVSLLTHDTTGDSIQALAHLDLLAKNNLYSLIMARKIDAKENSRAGSRNWAEDDVSVLLEYVETVKPLGQNGWIKVAQRRFGTDDINDGGARRKPPDRTRRALETLPGAAPARTR